jgi:hypothetical protein
MRAAPQKAARERARNALDPGGQGSDQQNLSVDEYGRAATQLLKQGADGVYLFCIERLSYAPAESWQSVIYFDSRKSRLTSRSLSARL